MTKKIILLFVLICSSNMWLNANVRAFFNYSVFASPGKGPYVETYLTISGNSVKFSPVAGGLQANINISWKIFKGAELVKSSNYNLNKI